MHGFNFFHSEVHHPKTSRVSLDTLILETAPVLLEILHQSTQTRQPRSNRPAVIGMCLIQIFQNEFGTENNDANSVCWSLWKAGVFR